MGHIRSIAGGVAGRQRVTVAGAFHAHVAAGDSEEFPGSLKVRGTAEGSAFFEAEFVKLDILFQVQRGEGANVAVVVRVIVKGTVVGADHVHLGGRARGFHQFAKGEAEGAGDAQGHSERGIGLLTFDLAEHGTAYTAAAGQRFQRPAALLPQVFEPLTKVPGDGVGRRTGGGGGFGLGGHDLRRPQREGEFPMAQERTVRQSGGMLRMLCLPVLILLSACSPKKEQEAASNAVSPAPAANSQQETAGANSAGGTARNDAAAVPYKQLGWDSATSRFLLDGKPFTGVTTDFYKPSGNPPVAKLKARYQITDGVYDGLVEEWYDNGQQKTKTSYVKGKHQGDNFYWNADGSLQVHKVWKDDVLVSETPGKAR